MRERWKAGSPDLVVLGRTPGRLVMIDVRDRPEAETVITRATWVRLIVQGLLMTAGALLVRAYYEPLLGAAVATTMSLTTLSLFHVFSGLSSRSPTGSIFTRDLIADRASCCSTVSRCC